MTTNLIEGYFSNVKVNCSHTILTLKEIIQTCVSYHKTNLQKTLKMKLNVNPDNYNGPKICQKIALILNENYFALTRYLLAKASNNNISVNENKEDFEGEYISCKCKAYKDLPCTHEMYNLILQHKNPMMEDINEIYKTISPTSIAMIETEEHEPIQVAHVAQEEGMLFNYNDLMEIFSEVASNASNKEVQSTVKRFIKEYNDLFIQEGNDPPRRNHGGRKTTYPSRIVRKHSRRKRKGYHCSICKRPGHNSQTCSMKNSSASTKIESEESSSDYSEYSYYSEDVEELSCKNMEIKISLVQSEYSSDNSDESNSNEEESYNMLGVDKDVNEKSLKIIKEMAEAEPNLIIAITTRSNNFIDKLFRNVKGELLRNIMFNAIPDLAGQASLIDDAHNHPEIEAIRGFFIQQFPIFFENLGKLIPQIENDKFVKMLIRLIYKINYLCDISDDLFD